MSFGGVPLHRDIQPVTQCAFKATIDWKAPDGISWPVDTAIHVLRDMKQPVISKQTQLSLGMLPASYPHRRVDQVASDPVSERTSHQILPDPPTPTHEEAFLKAHTVLLTISELAIYAPAWPTALHVDASRLFGLGFLLKKKLRPRGSWASWFEIPDRPRGLVRHDLAGVSESSLGMIDAASSSKDCHRSTW